MNILVIGNGFDLAHGLSTAYQDFLKFTDNYRNCLMDNYYEQMLEMESLINDNAWIKHFKRFYECNGWIGFEKEMSDIVKILDKKIPEFQKIKEKGAGGVKFLPMEQDSLKDFVPNINQCVIYDKNFIPDNKDRMLKDLNQLIRSLEIYLACYINHSSVKKISPDIKNIHIDKVLSFNYTNTYERVYNSDEKMQVEYNYIHGKADMNNTIESNNMVLGIDEYLPDDRKNKDIEFIAFKKYYQRIYKGTGCKYKDWVNAIRGENTLYMKMKDDCEVFLKKGYGLANEIEEKRAELKKLNENPPKHNLYIFGHSLDVTDKDVLRDLILNDNVYTTIFYVKKDVLGQQIANLVKVIGQDELIKRTGGKDKLIEFKPQKPMKEITES